MVRAKKLFNKKYISGINIAILRLFRYSDLSVRAYKEIDTEKDESIINFVILRLRFDKRPGCDTCIFLKYTIKMKLDQGSCEDPGESDHHYDRGPFIKFIVHLMSDSDYLRQKYEYLQNK